ncbi:M15 family metallopeptidase [Colwellia psychrerythraea]|uniref:Peptidase M15B and M15C DD-carboxypeptidase VanY/endolysin n=1 Tax=Colwellia psychrerythraea TaxID=28229 RepID=A0A099KBD9_COLPS|nr:M15 family metallopeptidase [Colwellia psychrerythraea]KGJ87392.1 peptidase M15B and M15C DD-carboxypeptidase VanY/endolysin [Colwellia psychrerythraea]
MQKFKAINRAQVLGKTEEHLYYLNERVAIHQEMKPAFDAIVTAAKTDGIDLKIASGFRSFDRQLMLWNNKFSGKTAIKDINGDIVVVDNLSSLQIIESILLYSALPGASRHHWGCDIDVYAPNLLAQNYQLQLEPWEYSESGPLAELSSWLLQHAHRFGFYFPYATFQGGIAQEPWHLSYLPLAQQFQQTFSAEQLAQTLQSSNILGKKVIIDNLDLIAKRYINNVCAAPTNVILT